MLLIPKGGNRAHYPHIVNRAEERPKLIGLRRPLRPVRWVDTFDFRLVVEELSDWTIVTVKHVGTEYDNFVEQLLDVR